MILSFLYAHKQWIHSLQSHIQQCDTFIAVLDINRLRNYITVKYLLRAHVSLKECIGDVVTSYVRFGS